MTQPLPPLPPAPPLPGPDSPWSGPTVMATPDDAPRPWPTGPSIDDDDFDDTCGPVPVLRDPWHGTRFPGATVMATPDDAPRPWPKPPFPPPPPPKPPTAAFLPGPPPPAPAPRPQPTPIPPPPLDPPPSTRAYRLAHAISAMACRYGMAERRVAYAWGRYLHSHAEHDAAESQRWGRAADRRYQAIQRLTRALRDLGATA